MRKGERIYLTFEDHCIGVNIKSKLGGSVQTGFSLECCIADGRIELRNPWHRFQPDEFATLRGFLNAFEPQLDRARKERDDAYNRRNKPKYPIKSRKADFSKIKINADMEARYQAILRKLTLPMPAIAGHPVTYPECLVSDPRYAPRNP